MTLSLVACSGAASPPPSGSPAESPRPTPSAASAKSVPTVTKAPEGDGTLKIKLNVLNPEQKQDKYSVFFASTGRVGKEKYLTKNSFAGPFTVDADGELTLSIEDDLKNFLYRVSGIDGPKTAELVVTRIEDTNIRNPLSEPIKLEFSNLTETGRTTTDRGNELAVDITDSALNDLYDEEVFLVKVVPEEIQDGGGYPTIDYGKPGSAIKSQLQRGSSGPDFLVPFPVKEIKSRGFREARLIVLDMDNKVRSEPLSLTFDENGRCEQGALVMIKTFK